MSIRNFPNQNTYKKYLIPISLFYSTIYFIVHRDILFKILTFLVMLLLSFWNSNLIFLFLSSIIWNHYVRMREKVFTSIIFL